MRSVRATRHTTYELLFDYHSSDEFPIAIFFHRCSAHALFTGTHLNDLSSIISNRDDGDDGVSGGGELSAGGGSGGTMYIASPDMIITGTVQSQGGTGGVEYGNSGPYDTAKGGNGGEGRIYLDDDNLTDNCFRRTHTRL